VYLRVHVSVYPIPIRVCCVGFSGIFCGFFCYTGCVGVSAILAMWVCLLHWLCICVCYTGYVVVSAVLAVRVCLLYWLCRCVCYSGCAECVCYTGCVGVSAIMTVYLCLFTLLCWLCGFVSAMLAVLVCLL